MVGESIEFVLRNGDRWFSLVEERDDGFVIVFINDWNDGFVWVVRVISDFLDESFGMDNIESGDIEEFFGVEFVSFFENFSGDWNGVVDGVGDDEDEGVWVVLDDVFDEVFDDVGVDFEEIVMGYVWFVYVVMWY